MAPLAISMSLPSCSRNLSLAVIETTFAPARPNSARIVLERMSSGPVITTAFLVFGSRKKFPEMPWIEGGLPVMIETLFGQVKLGITHSAMVLKPSLMKRATFGMIPSSSARSK